MRSKGSRSVVVVSARKSKLAMYVVY